MNDLIVAAALLADWALLWSTDRRRPFSAVEAAFWASVWAVYVIWFMADDQILSMISSGGISGWFAYLAWTRRKPRQRRPSKGLRRIRDLGYRLVVIPAS